MTHAPRDDDALQPGAGRDLPAATAPVTSAMVAANLAVFVFIALHGGGWGVARPEAFPGLGSNFGPLTTDGHWWRLASSVFVHFGLLHLAVNLYALWDVGRLVERLYGSVPYAFLYAASGVAGSLASVAWNPWVHSAGASGAIFGVLGALLAYALKPGMGLAPEIVRAHRAAALVFIGYSLAIGLVGSGIDNAAHLGGLVTGSALGYVLARPVAAGPRSISAPQALAAVAILAVTLGAAASHMRNTGPAYREEEAFRTALEGFIEEGRPLEEAVRQGFALWRKRALRDEELIRLLETEAAHAERGIARLTAFRLDPTSPSRWREVQATLLRALPLQRDAYRLLVHGIRDRDAAAFSEAEAKRNEASALMSSLREKPRR